MGKTTFTRRNFLKAAAAVPLAPLVGRLAAGGEIRTPAPFDAAATVVAPPETKSRVVLVRDEKVLLEGHKADPAVVQRMLDDAVSALFGEKDPVAAWKTIVKPTDIVGIKTNSWRFLPTGPAVEQALKKRVMDAGVPEDRIGVRDWGVLNDPIFKEATVLINARPARSHHWSGMGSCIKNYILFVPKPSEYHPDSCADLGSIWNLPHVKGRTRLNVNVMLTPLFHGIGPNHFSEQFIWPYAGLVVGQDVVAVDSTAVRILEAQRRSHFGEDRPLQPPAHHVLYADTRHHLGTADPAKIELVKLGWADGVLI